MSSNLATRPWWQTLECRVQTEMLMPLARRRILQDMIRSVTQSKTGKQPCAVVVDEHTLKVLSACVKVYDILDEGASVVEAIEKKRQPLPEVGAIYFISPTVANIEAVIEDFKNEKRPQHSHVHLLFSSSLPTDVDLMDRLVRASALLPRLRSFVEFNLDFVCYEGRVFHLDRPTGLIDLYSSPPHLQAGIIQGIANQLGTVCITMGDLPNIRFQSTPSRLTEQLAASVHAKISKVDTQLHGLTRGRSTLLILDRSVDLCSLFVHEYTYQAVAYDLLAIPCCSPPRDPAASVSSIISDDTFEYEFTTSGGEVQRKVALLNESDEVFVRYRHQHITTVNKGVTEDVRRFARDNAAAQLNKGKAMSNEETIRAIRALPQYQESLAKYWAHVTMSEQCFRELQQRGTVKLGTLEQDLATGVDKDGNEISASKALSQLGTSLSDPTSGMEEKLRLLLLYFVCMDGVKEDDRRKMLEAAQLPLDYARCIYNFFKTSLLDQGATAAPTEGKQRHTHRYANDKEKIKFFHRRAKVAEYELSRFEPEIKAITEKLIHDTLHGGKFPYVAEPERKAGKKDASGGGAVRARNIDWSMGATQTDVPATKLAGASKAQAATKRYTVFILGGAMFNELRAVYEISRQEGAEVILGSTSIMTPRRVFELLKT